MIKSIATPFALALTALSVAGCGAGSLLTTGSVAPQAPSTTAAAAPKPSTPIDRALHVASTSARAHKCGFYFDAAALRSAFLAAEAARGTTGDLLTKAGQSYDFTASRIAASIKQSEAYCNPTRTATIKTALNNALAGNFEPPVKKAVVADTGVLGGLFDVGPATQDKFNPDVIYDPVLNGAKRY